MSKINQISLIASAGENDPKNAQNPEVLKNNQEPHSAAPKSGNRQKNSPQGLKGSPMPEDTPASATAAIQNATPTSSGLAAPASAVSQVSQRPQRKAKTKEAVLKHLNRDVELLEEKKGERKSVSKKQSGAQAPNNVHGINVNQNSTSGKRSAGKGGAAANNASAANNTGGGKNSQSKADAAKDKQQNMQIPSSIVKQSNVGNAAGGGPPGQLTPFVSSIIPKNQATNQNEPGQGQSAGDAATSGNARGEAVAAGNKQEGQNNATRSSKKSSVVTKASNNTQQKPGSAGKRSAPKDNQQAQKPASAKSSVPKRSQPTKPNNQVNQAKSSAKSSITKKQAQQSPPNDHKLKKSERNVGKQSAQHQQNKSSKNQQNTKGSPKHLESSVSEIEEEQLNYAGDQVGEVEYQENEISEKFKKPHRQSRNQNRESDSEQNDEDDDDMLDEEGEEEDSELDDDLDDDPDDDESDSADLEDDEDEEEQPDDPEEKNHRLSLELRRQRKAALRREARIANRALRIKMGKSGAQAASRRSIKKGKDACQRKLWNNAEDNAIVELVSQYGTKRWTFIAQQLTQVYRIGWRTGKQCRERWHNHLDPNIKKSPINGEEERIIFDAHKVYGNKWADIAKLLVGRSDNCIKNYYYSTLRKHIRRINKSLKQCQVAKKLNLKIKTLTADILFPLVKDAKITYSQVKSIDAKKFEDLEHTMRMIFNHEDGQQVTQRGIIAAAQNRLKVEKQLEEMRERERQEQQERGSDEEDEADLEEEDNVSMAEIAEKSEKPLKKGGHQSQSKEMKKKQKSKAITGQKRSKAAASHRNEDDQVAEDGRGNKGSKRQRVSEGGAVSDETESEDVGGDESNDDDQDEDASSGDGENERNADMSDDSQVCPVDQEEPQEIPDQHSQQTSSQQNESKEQYSLKKKGKKTKTKQQDTSLQKMLPAPVSTAPSNPFGAPGSANSLNPTANQNKANHQGKGQNQNNVGFPKSLQLKQPISKNQKAGSNAQKPPNAGMSENMKMGVSSVIPGGPPGSAGKHPGQAPRVGSIAMGGVAGPVTAAMQSMSGVHNVFKSSLIDSQLQQKIKLKKEVTEMDGDVTNGNFDNRSNGSGHEALHRSGHSLHKKDKKHKKKKKNKKSHREDGGRHKSKGLHLHHQSAMFQGLPGLGLPPSTNVDELAAQYDFFDAELASRLHPHTGAMDMLQLTNQKTSGNSKMYPQLYDPSMLSSRQKLKEQQASQSIGGFTGGPGAAGPPTWSGSGHQSSSGGQQSGAASNFPPHPYPPGMHQFMYQAPYYMQGMGQFFPYGPGMHHPMGGAAASGAGMYHLGQGGGVGLPTPKGKNKLGANSDKENLKLFKSQMSAGSVLGQLGAHQNQKQSKSSKNNTSQKERDSPPHENGEQDESNCEPEKRQSTEPNTNAADDTKRTPAEGASTQATKAKKGLKEDKKDKTQPGSGNDPHYMSHEALSNFFGAGVHPMPLQFYQKAGHLPPHYGMIPPHHPGMAPYFAMHGPPIPHLHQHQHSYHHQSVKERHGAHHHGHGHDGPTSRGAAGTQNCQRQFILPVTPNNLKQQHLFGGGEKALLGGLGALAASSQAAEAEGAGLVTRRNRANSNLTHSQLAAGAGFQQHTGHKRGAEDSAFQHQDRDKGAANDRKLPAAPLSLQKRCSSATNLNAHLQREQPPQFNNNITFMINNFGPTHPAQPGQAATTGGAQSQNQRGGDTRSQNEEASKSANHLPLQEKERLDLKEKIQGALSPTKQISAQKCDMASKNAGAAHSKQAGNQAMDAKGNSSVSFKQSFKPQRIGQLNDMFQRRIQEAIESRGVTPSNALQAPLISASNLLLSSAAQAQQVFGAGTAHFSHILPQPSQAYRVAGRRGSASGNQQSQVGGTAQGRLQAGTPRLFFGASRQPTSTTPGGGTRAQAVAKAENEFQNGEQSQPPQSQRHFNLNSGHTFNGVYTLGSKLNTKTNAQLTANKANSIITPKANTAGNDPETHRKLLEKMQQDAEMKNLENNEIAACSLISLGGAFTKKQAFSMEQAREQPGGSSKKKETNAQYKDLKHANVIPHSGDSFHVHTEAAEQRPPRQAIESRRDGKPPFDRFPERDSLGLFCVNPNAFGGMDGIGGSLALNHEPLASIYTGAPEPRSGLVPITGDSSAGLANKRQEGLISTPMLGPPREEGAVTSYNRLSEARSDDQDEDGERPQHQSSNIQQVLLTSFVDQISKGDEMKMIDVENVDMLPAEEDGEQRKRQADSILDQTENDCGSSGQMEID